jgi:hypothetical protein
VLEELLEGKVLVNSGGVVDAETVVVMGVTESWGLGKRGAKGKEWRSR